MSWKEYLENRNKKIELIFSLVYLTAILTTLTKFLNFVEMREGVVLPDPILNLFNPIDLTWLIFALIYISLIVAIVTLIRNPEKLVFAIQLYSMMVTVRIIAMYILPLEPPAKMILLNDPFVQFFGSGQTLTKDLFFSGHTATLFLLFLISDYKIMKYIFGFSTVIVGLAVLLQHVHYSIDVFAAVFFTYACYKILLNIKSILE